MQELGGSGSLKDAMLRDEQLTSTDLTSPAEEKEASSSGGGTAARDMLGVIPYANPWATDDHWRSAMIEGTSNPQVLSSSAESLLPKKKKARAMYHS